ncbi:anthranilate synthase component I [Candidatus Viadribacter manganicus]|uniref:Anthranilate synthase component 1 n=1 Tax=Candidatus Viadribacter manganicus TaxID=1759059 RepID=A0A1B1ADA5_9PROT|nr:anthranilate synthase component I [Candidatus Viadribacter manganicus]ANP44538.1 anthranilate synthase [Candidatus Viadribacter manganicus]
MNATAVALEPALADYAEAHATGGGVVWMRRVSDLETPVAAMLKLGAGKPGAFLLESVQGGDFRGRYSIIGLKPDLVWRVRDGKAAISRGGFADSAFRPQRDAPLKSLRKLLSRSALKLPDHLPPMSAGLFGYLGYDMVRQVERLPAKEADPIGTPEALLVRPTIVAVFDNVTGEITLITPARRRAGQSAAGAYEAARVRLERVWRALDRPLPRKSGKVLAPEVVEPHSNTAPDAYRALVTKCKAYCRAGDIFQVVPSQRFSAPLKAPPFALYRSLRRMNPSPFLYYLNFADFAVVGSSPEILVRKRGDTITIRPIAGTRPRGATPAEDSALEQDLLADPKERAEHLMLVDLARNDLGRVAVRGSKAGSNAAAATAGSAHVRVTEAFTIERYSHVMHIVSNVEGELKPDLSALDALLAGFPHGTVTGAPKIRAMEIINEVEPHKRGIYAGGVGYFGAGGDMDTCIALRTAVVKDGKLFVQAGGGVVLDSDPEAELQETLHKSRALFRAASEAWRYA